ncbi:MAG: choline dehydrogenase [Bradyrhizobium sp.]|nr:choline dehydrogenase [Bradyrhizobium sp.]
MKAARRTGIARYDYIVVGAGSSGCVVANRLSADPTVRVALVEAGGKDDWHWIHVPAGTLHVVGSPRTDWNYMGEIEPELGRSMPVARGRVLGGSSSINGTVYTRGQARDYDHWRQLGNHGWSWDDVLPYFKRSEDFEQGADPFHGAGGELSVERPRINWPVLETVQRAAAWAGIPPSPDFNRGDAEGCGYFHVTQRRGRRASAARAFLKPIRHRRNLDVITDVQCTRLRFDGRRVIGIEGVRDGAPISIDAAGEVLLCAGSIGSPQILQVSGIGPVGVLRDAGVRVRHALPGVGENLQDHLSMRFTQKVGRAQTLNTRFHHPIKKAMILVEYLVRRSGPLCMGAPLLGGFARSDEMRETPNLQFLVSPASFSAPFAPPDRFDAISGGIYNVRPRSRGHVRIRTAYIQDHPAIVHNYLQDADDQRVAIDSLKLMRRIFAAPVFQALAPEELRPSPDAQTDEALLAAGRETCGTAFHQVGTCKMGPDELAVVDERLRVHGFEGLRVIDASIMPALVSANTNAAAIMIGEKAADMIVADRRASPQA